MKHAFYALLHVVPFILASFKNNGVKRSTMNISYDVPPNQVRTGDTVQRSGGRSEKPSYWSSERPSTGRNKCCHMVDPSWNVMANGDAQEEKWKGNCRIEWVASTLHTASEHDVSSITTADAHTSAASSRLNWRSRWFKCTRPFRRKTIWFLRVCHHISTCLYLVL